MEQFSAEDGDSTEEIQQATDLTEESRSSSAMGFNKPLKFIAIAVVGISLVDLVVLFVEFFVSELPPVYWAISTVYLVICCIPAYGIIRPAHLAANKLGHAIAAISVIVGTVIVSPLNLLLILGPGYQTISSWILVLGGTLAFLLSIIMLAKILKFVRSNTTLA